MLNNALEHLKLGKFILVHDDEYRENEVDMIIAAEFITPDRVARLRLHAGGLICIAIDHVLGKNIGIEYMHDILYNYYNANDSLKKMIIGLAPYGDKSSFSISVNHIKTYTGITDVDRAITIKEMANLCRIDKPMDYFVSSFKTPGHIPILIASNKLLIDRKGHTEMSICLAKLANITPVTVICEMLDADTHNALSSKKAEKYAKQNSIPFISSHELLELSNVY